MSDYNFYMRQIGTNDSTEYALGEKFPTFLMKSVSGLLESGDPTNSYIETFAGTSKVKVYVARESASVGTVVMNVLFVGKTCAEDYDAFVSFISGSILEYRDTYRKKTVKLIKSKSPKISTDRRRDDKSAIEVAFTFKKIEI